MRNWLPKFTKRQWLTLIIIGLADFGNAICYSLQAPFFPQEAEKKGCTASEYGLVFGVFELVIFVLSPIFGQYINVIGPKVLFNSGILTTSLSSIVFGMLDKIEGHNAFLASAFIVRIIEAIGTAAFLTASFSLIAKEFPDSVGVTFASLETFFGLGLIAGPMIGASLYQIGGFFLPFGTLGSLLFTTAIVIFFVLPTHNEPIQQEQSKSSMFSLLKIPGIIVGSMSIIAASASIGFLAATLEPHLRPFDLSPVLLGAIFVIHGGLYATTAPIWGCMIDKFLHPKLAASMGSILIAIAFSLVGPVSFLPLETTIPLVITGLVMEGLGLAAVLVSSFTDALRTSFRHGFQDNITTYGLVSGLWASTFALGAFFGPSISGMLYDSIGFRKAVLFIIVLHITVGLIVLITFILETKPQPYKELDASEPLLRNHERIFREKPNNGSALPTDQRKTGSLTDVMVCKGLNHKNCNSWSSRCEIDGRLTRNGSYYGSCVDRIPQRVPCTVERETIA